MKNLDETTFAIKMPNYPFFRNEIFVDEEGKEIHFQTVVIPVKDYIELIKDKSFDDGYSCGAMRTLEKIFGEDD